MAFDFEKVRETIEQASLEKSLNHPKREEFKEVVVESFGKYLSAKGRHHRDGKIEQRNIRRLTDMMVLADGDVRDWRVLDLGCGSPNEGWPVYEHKGWYPYKAEILTNLGAKVVGVDYRPNPEATYEHRVLDFGEFCEHFHYGDCFDPNLKRQSFDQEKIELAKRKLEGDFDLVIGTSLVNSGLTHNDNGWDTLIQLLSMCARPSQVQFFDSFYGHGIIYEETKSRYIWNLKR